MTGGKTRKIQTRKLDLQSRLPLAAAGGVICKVEYTSAVLESMTSPRRTFDRKL